MSKQDVIEIEGTVKEALPNAMFKVELPNGKEILSKQTLIVEIPFLLISTLGKVFHHYKKFYKLAQISKISRNNITCTGSCIIKKIPRLAENELRYCHLY